MISFPLRWRKLSVTALLLLAAFGFVSTRSAPPPRPAVPAPTAAQPNVPRRPSPQAVAAAELKKATEAQEKARLLEERRLKDEKLRPIIRANAKEIYFGNSPVGGNPNGDASLVVFFDYNDGYYKRSAGDIVALTASDPTLRIVYKELPILGSGSEDASRIVLAARNQGKYAAMHAAMLGVKVANEASALEAAKELGLNIDRLKRDMLNIEIETELVDTAKLALLLEINGVPSFIANDTLVMGAADNLREILAALIDQERKSRR